MRKIDEVFKNADFSRGSDHKQRLHDTLFDGDSSREAFSLTDDQLDMVAAGRKEKQATKSPM